MNVKNWKKELARDALVFGSIPLYILVVLRVAILRDVPYLSQFIFAGIIFFLLSAIFKADLYSGITLILVVFISMHYNRMLFTVSVILLYFAVPASLLYLGIKRKKIVKGIIFGAISTAISYLLVDLLLQLKFF